VPNPVVLAQAFSASATHTVGVNFSTVDLATMRILAGTVALALLLSSQSVIFAVAVTHAFAYTSSAVGENSSVISTDTFLLSIEIKNAFSHWFAVQTAGFVPTFRIIGMTISTFTANPWGASQGMSVNNTMSLWCTSDVVAWTVTAVAVGVCTSGVFTPTSRKLVVFQGDTMAVLTVAVALCCAFRIVIRSIATVASSLPAHAP